MILIILFPILLFANSISIKGKWKNSSLKDEALIFFEKNEPSLLDKVQSALEEIDDDKSQILKSLSDFVHQPLFGLLNLSLSLRFYQPAASIKSPKDGHPYLHGWYLLEKIYSQQTLRDVQKIHFSMVNSLDRYRSPIEKLNFLKESSFSITSLFNSVNKNKATTVAQQNINKYPRNYFYSGINGRIIKSQYLDILDGLIEEYHVSKLFTFSKSLLERAGYREPHYFTQQPQNMQVLVSHNLDKLREKWSDEPKMSSSDYWEILKCKKKIVVVNIFFDLHSPESPVILNWAKEHILKSSPLYFNVTFNFDINNETEKHIAYAWHQSVDTLGVRNSVIFMVDGFKRNNFKRAYKATLPSLSWKKLKENMVSGHKHTVRMMEELKYCKEMNITTAVAINGEFIQERPIFPIVEDRLFACITRIKRAVQNGVKVNFSDIIKWTAKNSIQMNSSTYPIEITFNNYITIHGFSNKVIKKAASKIVSLSKKDSDENSSLKYPVIVLNNKKHHTIFDVDSSEFSEDELQLLKANKKDVFTVIGPLTFQGEVLTHDQLKFCQDYIDYVFITQNLESNLTDEHLLLALLFRSTNALDGIDRRPISSKLPDTYKIELKNDSPLTWSIVDDPVSFQGAVILDMASHVFGSGAASVIYHPNVNHDEYKTVPVQFGYNFHSSFDNDEIKFDDNIYYVRTSSYWSTQKETPQKNNNSNIELTCTSIISTSLLSPKGKRVKISDITVTSTNDVGYFSPVLPIGKYKTKGMSSKSYESDDTFVIDSFVPHIRFYFSNDEEINPSSQNSNNLNIVLRADNDSELVINDIRILLYTIKNNTKETTKIKLFIATPFPFIQIKDIETAIIPTYLPRFYQMRLISLRQLTNNWKFILSDIYLSSSEKYLFLDTNMIFTGDASRFLRLDMSDGAVVASPVMTDSWFNKRGKPWNTRNYLMMRYKRPYHTSNLIWIDMNKWTKLHISDRFRMLLSSYVEANKHNANIGEVIFNSIQLYAQFITLPEEIAFNSNRSPARLAKKALSIDLSSPEALRLAKIKYEKIRQQALNQYA